MAAKPARPRRTPCCSPTPTEVGRVAVTHIARLMHEYGGLLLERNIRRFLGQSNRVNQDRIATLQDPTTRPNFYFYNNGITMVCQQLRHNELLARNFAVQVKNLQIINGGQTFKAIQHVLEARPDDDYSEAHVRVRLYALDDGDPSIVDRITYATSCSAGCAPQQTSSTSRPPRSAATTTDTPRISAQSHDRAYPRSTRTRNHAREINGPLQAGGPVLSSHSG